MRAVYKVKPTWVDLRSHRSSQQQEDNVLCDQLKLHLLSLLVKELHTYISQEGCREVCAVSCETCATILRHIIVAVSCCCN